MFTVRGLRFKPYVSSVFSSRGPLEGPHHHQYYLLAFLYIFPEFLLREFALETTRAISLGNSRLTLTVGSDIEYIRTHIFPRVRTRKRLTRRFGFLSLSRTLTSSEAPSRGGRSLVRAQFALYLT